jgi:hypothetical protein
VGSAANVENGLRREGMRASERPKQNGLTAVIGVTGLMLVRKEVSVIEGIRQTRPSELTGQREESVQLGRMILS